MELAPSLPMISLRTHNVLDYVAALALILSPRLFAFTGIPAANGVFTSLGIALVAYSLVTRYRYSVVKLLPLRAHLFLDASLVVILLLAPSIWGYRSFLTGLQNGVHYVLGLGLIALVAFTSGAGERASQAEQEPSRRRRAA